MNESPYIPNSFLRESWKRKAMAESGASNEVKNAEKIYLNISSESQKNPELQTLFNSVKDALIRYKRIVNEIRKSRDGSAIGDIEARDKNMHYAHNRLIDTLNILSRQFRERGLDNHWREEIGTSRPAVSSWAQEIDENFLLPRKK